jgi:hypothetical protein
MLRAMARRATGRQRSLVTAAMQNLRPSGEQSFEELVARLLSKVSGERIRRCKAGTQGGVDALAEIPFAVENKRYAGQLNARELVGGLTDAAGAYPDLQLWVLVTTYPLAAQDRTKVADAGLRQGIAVLIVDTTSAESELPGVSGLAALAATDIDSTLAVLSDPSWRGRGRKPNLKTVKAELKRIRRMSEFSAWTDRLRKELRELPTWRYLVRSQNEKLLSYIMKSARNAFGTPFNPSVAVARTVESELSDWARACTGAQACEPAVVTGERYDGKTWLVYRWLSANLPSLPVPVFLFSSREVQLIGGDLWSLVARQSQDVLGSFANHANSILRRQRSKRDDSAWCIVILDGANEYVTDPQARAAAVLWALPPESNPLRTEAQAAAANQQTFPEIPTQKVRSCALLVTCRSRDFDEDSSWLGYGRIRRIRLNPYDDREFADALALRKMSEEDIADLPESAAKMIRHPRYLDLMLRHREELGQFAVITADVLHYLDASDKVPSAARLSPDAFKEFLRGLAEAWGQQRRLSYSEIRHRLRDVTDSVDTAMAALMSEGVVTRSGESFVPDPERLALGMGLFIRDRLLSVSENERADTLADILGPDSDDDEKVRWLRSAVTTAVLAGDASTSPETVDLLLATWLSSRNFSKQDLADVKSLTPLIFEAILRLVSRPSVDSGLLLMATAMIEQELAHHHESVANAIRRWFRLVPGDNPWHGQDEQNEREEARRVAIAASEDSVRDLELCVTAPSAGKSARERHRLGLSILSDRGLVVDPSDLLALVAARGVTHWNLSDGEEFALRVVLASVERSWFESQVQTAEVAPKAGWTAFVRDLIGYSDRQDLADLEARLPAVESLRWPKGVTRADLATVSQSLGDKEFLRLAERAAYLALDPAGPEPASAWRQRLAKTATARFASVGKLHASRSRTSDDLDLEGLEPALARWVPDVAARIMHSFLADIPRRVAAGEESWSWAIEENAALLTQADRRTLLQVVLATPAKTQGLQHAFRRAYLCVMAGAPSTERLRLLLSHPFVDFEWTSFYEILAFAGDDALHRRTVAAVRAERDSVRLKRARQLLAQLGGWEPSVRDMARLVGELASGSDRESEYAAHTLLRYSRIPVDTPADDLGPLVRIANSLAEEAWQYEAFHDVKRRHRLRGAEWLGRARAAPMTARHKGAVESEDDAAVASGIDRFAVQIEKRLSQPVFGHAEQFPEGIAERISDSAFQRWVDLLLASRDAHHLWDSAVLVPVLRRALHTGHPAARDLWTMAYPFSRKRSWSHERLVTRGLDWTLVNIHDPSVNDKLARAILKDLVLDCRSDSELVSVAMGARVESCVRLLSIVRELLDDPNDVHRARARFIAGWMPEDINVRQRLTAPDASRWVARVGESAIRRLNREQRAREWLQRFLGEARRAHRWAAGRLFFACTDAATPFWADELLAKPKASPPRRAEALLLVGRIRAKVDDSEFRENFLGHSVRDLASVARPWHEPTTWADIDVTAHQTEDSE